MKYFTIRDSKADGWNTPMLSATRQTVMRELAVKLRENPVMAEYSSDFTLFETGEFDQVTGVTTGYPQPSFVCDISDLVNAETDKDRHAANSS